MAPASICLALGRVHDLSDAAAAGGVGWLSTSEQARFARLKTPLRQAQFLSGRWLARQVLVAAYGGGADRWSLSAPESGPPQIHDSWAQAGTLYLGLSHSADHVACAVSSLPLGLDLEAASAKRNLVGIADVICTPAERARWPATQGPEQAVCFYDLWTLKEAWIKFHAEDLSPARLAQIHTQRAEPGQPANARLWRRPGLTLALVADADAPVQWLGNEGGAFEAWTIEEQAATGAIAPGLTKPA